ncbi:hypothetical protein SAMN04488066_103133 [Halorubrum aquaticum]|uniref:Uncharacterized protein n=1 Tax=Halorubrum aquaticum TaxID=387340 RepID=A0A1I2ZUQ1_9EURY|nr:DUF6653 family protein [Halorubrum aquaticum]SFH41336.1 hypothetical protein SAMN04488066_103133 [Halorubrum aquaticum]
MDPLGSVSDTVWRRHANPKSGWSRVLVTPVLLYAVYRRDGRIAALALAFTVVNPVLFSPPATDDAWMTRVVLAERWWIDEREEAVLSRSYPAVLNLINLPVFAYAFLSAYRKRPVRATLAGLASILLKLRFVDELVRRYDAERAGSSGE